jgi:hypothetical protein
MIHSNERKLCLSGWLKMHHQNEYNTSLKLQKFLFLYETFSKISGEVFDFSHLRGYKNGPVFSNVWGDYTKERAYFDDVSVSVYNEKKDIINSVRAKKCAFIVGTMTEKELSELTHGLNLWKSKEKRIMEGELQVDLEACDFNSDDEKLIRLLDNMYSEEMIDNSSIINLDKNYFVFRTNEISKLTETHFDVLLSLSEREELHNPVYVEIDEEGRLIID